MNTNSKLNVKFALTVVLVGLVIAIAVPGDVFAGSLGIVEIKIHAKNLSTDDPLGDPGMVGDSLKVKADLSTGAFANGTIRFNDVSIPMSLQVYVMYQGVITLYDDIQRKVIIDISAGDAYPTILVEDGGGVPLARFTGGIDDLGIDIEID